MNNQFYTTAFTLILFSSIANAQNVGIGTREPKSKLHVAGDLRVDSLSNKVDSGIVVHDPEGKMRSVSFTGNRSDVLRGDGTFGANASLATSASWLTTGNAGIDTAVNFLGTTDDQPLLLRVNNIRAGEINPVSGNIAIGLRSLPLNREFIPDPSNPPGYNNIAIGTDALSKNVNGKKIIAIGDSALFNQPGNPEVYYDLSVNLGIGSKALFSNVDGTGNTAVGENALYKSLSGNNTALGSKALYNNESGSANTAVGYETMYSTDLLQNGFWNTAVGFRSMYAGGNRSTAVGLYSCSFVYGDGNTAVGTNALSGQWNFAGGGAYKSGNYNAAFGFEALASSERGRTYEERYSVGDYNVAIGAFSLYKHETGHSNVAIGGYALHNNLIAGNLVAIGDSALYNQVMNPSGYYANTAVGSKSLYKNTTGYYNTATGFQSLHLNTTGANNTANGYLAMRANTTGASNTSFGSQSLYSNTTSSNNTAVGTQSLYSNNTGQNNTALGYRALYASTSGSGNTAQGFSALLTNTTGTNNTALGNGADVTAGTFTNATAIGYAAKVDASNKVRIGNASVTRIEGQVPFTTPSDGRFKFNVQEDVSGLDFILRLRPVTYQFDVKGFDKVDDQLPAASISAYENAQQIRRTGFIAQEVEKAALESGYNFSGIDRPRNDGEHYSLSYEAFVVPLVKAMQEQQEIIDTQKKQIKTQDDKIEQLIREMQELKKTLSSKN